MVPLRGTATRPGGMEGANEALNALLRQGTDMTPARPLFRKEKGTIMSDREQDDSPLADPGVKAALKDGRDSSYIFLLSCPSCGVLGYYNQGSHFTCRMCKRSWHVVTEDEPQEASDFPTMILDEPVTLADYQDGSPDGYEPWDGDIFSIDLGGH